MIFQLNECSRVCNFALNVNLNNEDIQTNMLAIKTLFLFAMSEIKRDEKLCFKTLSFICPG